jgi:hypothetical protein
VAVSRAARRRTPQLPPARPVLDQLGIPARASRLAAWRELARQAPPAILADALGVSAGTAMRHAFLGGADWSVYAARGQAHTPGETSQ